MTAPRKMYQRIADSMAGAIATGRYPVGSRLPAERDLAEELNVSRPTVREAMIALEIRGLVEARHGSGVYVTASPADRLPAPELDVGAFELMEARILFEGEAAALAANARDDAAIAELRGLIAAMDGGDDEDAVYRADRAFHIRIAAATGNDVIRLTIERLWDLRETSPLCIHMFAQARREGVLARIAEHRDILAAIEAGDPHRARASMRAHLQRVVDDILEATRLELFQKAQAEAEAHQHRVSRHAMI